ncbi:site-specific integrase [Clostridia bacterium]|nr:site-specific integrase [Clostridia bacterium]
MARLGKGIYKRSDGRYEGRYRKGRNSDGSLLYGHVYAKTAAETQVKLSAVSANLSLRITNAATISSTLRDYLTFIQSQVKLSTHSVYTRYLDKYIEPLLGSVRISKLTQANVQSFADTQINNGLSARTVQSVISFLRAGLAEHIPAQTFTVKLPKHVARETHVLSCVEQSQLEAVLRAVDPINRVGITLCLYTGIRIGELCGLKWEDIDFVTGSLHIRRTIERIKTETVSAKTQLVIQTPKSDTSVRCIPLPQFLLDLLLEHKRGNSGDYVITLNGKPLDPRTVQKRFKRILELAKLRDINFHAATRHTFATRALENGVDIKTLSEILGHSNAAFTMNFYAHSVDAHKRECMEAVATVRR